MFLETCLPRQRQAIACSITQAGVFETQALWLHFLSAVLEVGFPCPAFAGLEELCFDRMNVLLPTAQIGCFLNSFVQSTQITFNVLLALGLGFLIIGTEDQDCR